MVIIEIDLKDILVKIDERLDWIEWKLEVFLCIEEKLEGLNGWVNCLEDS